MATVAVPTVVPEFFRSVAVTLHAEPFELSNHATTLAVPLTSASVLSSAIEQKLMSLLR